MKSLTNQPSTAGATFTLAFLLLRDCMMPGQFGRAVGVITAINGGVGGFDTMLGGSIADTIGFRGIFAVSLVINSPGGHATVGAYTAAMWSGVALAVLAVVAVLLMRMERRES